MVPWLDRRDRIGDRTDRQGHYPSCAGHARSADAVGRGDFDDRLPRTPANVNGKASWTSAEVACRVVGMGDQVEEADPVGSPAST